MKRVFIIATLFLVIQPSFSQYFWGGWVEPTFPTVTDTIFIFDSVSIGFPDVKVGSKITKHGDTILVQNCYQVRGGPHVGKIMVDTVNIGLLSEGRYYVKVQGSWYQQSPPFCYLNDTLFNELFIPFEVSRYPNGIGEETKMEVSLFPNPTNDFSVLKINSDASEEIEMILADISGKVLMEKKLSVHGEYSEKIDLRNYSTGIYALSLKSKKSVTHFRIMRM